mgnify:CR=1 FL=1
MLKPYSLSAGRIDDAALAEDKKTCRKIGPCGIGRHALYLNSFFVDRRYYVPLSMVTRVYKRVAMSKGGFSGKGIFATLSYLVVEFDGGQKVCNFKYEQQVDDFLEPLTEDYITLYKENSVLKAKMKILVEKLEEYRAQETKQSTAAADAEAKSAQLLKETQARCAAMLQNAEVNAQTNAQVNAANVQLAQLNQQLHAEQERLDYAKQTALNFISVVERDIQGHLELLETLKARDLTREAAPEQPQPAHEKPYDWQAEQPAAPAAPAPAPSEDAEKIATEISDNLEKLIGSDSGAETKTASAPALSKQSARPMHPESATIKFEDLKFGRNYDPTSSK